VPDLGVDAIREVDRRRIGREVQHITLGREHVDLVLEQVDLHRVQERLRVADLVLPLEEASEPGQLLVEARVLAAFLVGPVRATPNRHTMHFVRPDLDLDRLARVGDDSGVERLVAV